ncbi:Palmitoyl protein thioesterase [Ceraceosorus bombacis]|uniref:Palmitoyl-protein thioesterase 1 n=1 Tax=Ceraceosorus bombacis TaxID=401625 RepID=A0A0P1B8X9_9BASI|nr:Palmitoyl protein thioesterase [Ceraceosorus bombacis]
MVTVQRFASLWLVLASVLSWSRTTSASPLFGPSYHPVVIWHGLGDSAYSEGMQSFAQSLKDAFPGIFVHLAHVGDDVSSDQKAGFFGDLSKQLPLICKQIEDVPELKDGFDAIGFSQGGLFMRAYVERCQNAPPVRNLVTFGSPQNGISDLPACTGLLCRLAEGALRGGVYTDYAQTNVVSAQFYRDPRSETGYPAYLEHNRFLRDINNEVSINKDYKKQIINLESLVLLQFSQDKTIVPKESSWFGTYPLYNQSESETADEPKAQPIPLKQTALYTQDRLGLKTLDKRGALVLDVCKGQHMQIDVACQQKVFGTYIGTPASFRLLPRPIRNAWAYSLYNTTGLRAASMPPALNLLLFLTAIILIRTVYLFGTFARASYQKRQEGQIRLA